MLIKATDLNNNSVMVNMRNVFTVQEECFVTQNHGKPYTRIENMVGNHVNVKESPEYFQTRSR